MAESRVRRLGAEAVLLLPQLALLAVLARLSWLRWPDAVVDFGRELYVPWRLSAGDLLYRDIAWFNGPLSAFWNALLFKVFGVGLDTLVWANLALLLVILLLLNGLLRPAGRLASLAGGLCFAGLFAFAQYGWGGNNNYVTPYSHEIVHGLFLGLLSLWALGRWARAGSVLWAGLAGLALGMSFLTKPELFAATLGALALGALGHALVAERAERRRYARGLPVFLALALLPPLAAWVGLALYLTPGEALPALTAPWRQILGSEVGALHYYRWVMGLDRPRANAEAMAVAAAWTAALLLGLGALAFHVPRRGWGLRLAQLALVAAMLGIFLPYRKQLGWVDFPRMLPLFCAGYGVWLARRLWPGRDASPGERRRAAGLLPFVAFALLLMAKSVLRNGFYHYGFVLSMPAALALLVCLLGDAPRRLAARGASGSFFRAGVLALMLGAMGYYVEISLDWQGKKDIAVGQGRDRFLISDVWGHGSGELHEGRGRMLARFLEEVGSGGFGPGPGDTMVVLPEGVMLNYLLRVDNPTPYVNFMPAELAMFGEGTILESLRRHPPDYVLLLHRTTPEYGLPLFGRDYGEALLRWVREEYEPVYGLGAPPLEEAEAYGLRLMRRKSPPSSGIPTA